MGDKVGLDFRDEPRPCSVSNLARFRSDLSNAIIRQAQIASQDLKRTYHINQTYFMPSGHDERSSEIDSEPYVERWWWTDFIGDVHLSLYYDNKLLELLPGHTSIYVGRMDQLDPVLRTLYLALCEGEFDYVCNMKDSSAIQYSE